MIQKFDITISPFQLKRTIHLYLPQNYYETDERYPVMYMYDGHNLFSDNDATYGKSWGLREFLDQYDKHFIIVGIECNHEGRERLNEFCPYTLPDSHLGNIIGKGQQLMDWVIQELKPYIDQNYRTIPFRECTGIGGSSMGGLMALYSVIKYNLYFSKAACLSSAINICEKQLFQDLKQSTISSDTHVYLSFGKHEVRNEDASSYMKDLLFQFQNKFFQRNASCMINITNGEHNEASWEKENQTYMDYLWKG